jgi:hypothetical protein
MLARIERIEVGDTVDAEHNGLTIDHEALGLVLQRGLHNPRVAAGPVGGKVASFVRLTRVVGLSQKKPGSNPDRKSSKEQGTQAGLASSCRESQVDQQNWAFLTF